MISKVLFLCTGNYYRSRFAEILFNHLAGQTGAAWTAESRGIAADLGLDTVGPISSYTLEGLKTRRVVVGPNLRFPLQVQEQDLSAAGLIIALDAVEHRPLLEKRFPAWVERVTYWQVPDLPAMSAQEALNRIEQGVQGLLQQLAQK